MEHTYNTPSPKVSAIIGNLVRAVDSYDYKEVVSFGHSRTATHMDSQGLLQHAQDLLKLKPDKHPSMERGGGHKVP